MHISIPGNWASNNPVFAISHGPCAAAPSTPSQCSALPRHAVVPSRFPVQVRQAAQRRPPSEPLLSVRVIQRRVRRRNFPMCAGFPRLGVLRRLRPARARSAVGAPIPSPGRMPAAGTRNRAVPVFTVIRSAEEEPGCIPGGLATGTPQIFPVASRACSSTLPGSSRRNGKRRDAPRPAHIHQVRAGVKVKDVKRRFLAYSFPPRSPDPPHLAVLGRPGFVRAAPALPGTTRIRLPSATPPCCDRTARVSHLHSINSASRRTQRSW